MEKKELLFEGKQNTSTMREFNSEGARSYES